MRLIKMIILLISIGLLSTSFLFFKSKARDYEDMAIEIRAQVGKNLSKKHKMKLIGLSAGLMGSVYILGFSFEIFHPLDRNEARRLIVDCVEELLTAVNNNKEIRPFLKNYPFTTKNVHILIFSSDAKGREVIDPYISVVCISKSEKINFVIKELNKPKFHKKQYWEPYSEALNIVRGEVARNKLAP